MKQSSKEFFPGISKIQYEGPASKNPLAFKHYNAEELVAGKTMKDHLRFSVTYWHTIRGQLADMFGVGTAVRPWEDGTNSMKMAETRVRVAFEFLEKLGAPFYAFHDRDVAPEGKNLRETNRNLDAIVKAAQGGAAAHGRAVAVGHGLPVRASALRARRGDELQRRRVRLCRGAGQEGHRGDAHARRRGLRVLGRTRGLQHAARTPT